MTLGQLSTSEIGALSLLGNPVVSVSKIKNMEVKLGENVDRFTPVNNLLAGFLPYNCR